MRIVEKCVNMPRITPTPNKPTSVLALAWRGGRQPCTKAHLIETNMVDSTVSKVLRQKDKYLNLDDRSSSPIKRGKGKGADIEKTLTNYVHKNRQKGIPVTSEDIKEKAFMFSKGVSGVADSFLKSNGGASAWLE